MKLLSLKRVLSSLERRGDSYIFLYIRGDSYIFLYTPL